ncbi:SGNH/GDSL hydrolase family protein [Flavobacterium sp. UBA6031]|uniref:SGNH/GDSL hydrolase family protein n=1 Tax=Flavobacterium sp. UBA6031 TaxID=1946551 RepID=UPI0025C47B9F|nr:SGNH/GDSL hydrolase family protein [Flavobacterium sp. UBA6031]
MKKNKHILQLVAILILGVFISQSIFAQKKKVSCVGNSITYGYGLSNPSTQSYPSQMQVLLGTSSWNVGNFGVSARTMLKKGDMPYWNEQSFIDAKNYLPNLVMIELGTNDAKSWNWNNRGSEFVSNYKEMITIFRGLTSKPDIWIGLVPPGNNVSWNILGVVLKDSVNKRIKQVALQSGVGLIDIYDALGGNNTKWYSSTYFQTDSIHPTTAGATIIAQKVKGMLLMAKPLVTFANGKITSPDGDDYQWYFNGVPVAVSNGGKLKEMNVTASGKYKVSIKLSATNETRIVSQELDVQLTSVIPIHSNKIKVYPNPAYDSIQVEADDIKNATYSITDLSGKLLLKGHIHNGLEKINITTLLKGTYILEIGNEQVKLIKNK